MTILTITDKAMSNLVFMPVDSGSIHSYPMFTTLQTDTLDNTIEIHLYQINVPGSLITMC